MSAPAETEVLVRAQRLGELAEALAGTVDAEDHPLHPAAAAVEKMLGGSPSEAASWAAAGLAPDRAASVGLTSDVVVLTAFVGDRAAFERWRKAHGVVQNDPLKGLDVASSSELTILQTPARVAIAHAGGDAGRRAVDAWIVKPEEARPTPAAPISVTWRADKSAERIEASGHAATLLNQLVTELGEVKFSATSTGHRFEIDARTNGGGRPFFVPRTASVPRTKGLIVPGLLVLVRLAVEPAELANLVVSTLPQEQQASLRESLRVARDELAFDIEEGLIDNLGSDLLVAIYAIDDLETATFADVLSLSKTREVIAIGVKNREQVARALDIATQLSQGKLTKQTMDARAQYAWIEDDELRFALILEEAHLLVADSTVAFDRAHAFRSRPEPLDEGLRARGVAAIIDRPATSGIWIDARALGAQLRQAGRAAAAGWFTGLDSVGATVDMRTQDRASFQIHKLPPAK